MLRFIASGTRYSTYEDRDGNFVFLLNGTMRRAIDTSELPALWEQFVSDGQRGEDGWTIDVEEWLELIADTLQDDNVAFQENVWRCTECEVLIVSEDNHRTVTRDGDDVCLACYQRDFTECADCDTAHYNHELIGTLHDESICERCRDYNYYYCDDCEGYYHNESDGHEHGDGQCDCESPMTVFSVPHHGERLDNDDEIVVELPAGTITDEGIRAIVSVIHEAAYGVEDADERMRLYAVAGLPPQVGNEWQTKAGNFTKRLSKLAYKDLGYKIDSDLLGKIGTKAREHTSDTSELTVGVTRDLNQSPEEFGHEGSCWWESYGSSRCALKSNGGFGLRSFGNGYYGRVTGRVWVMPLKVQRDGTYGDRLKPTFNTDTPDAFIVFNGYGELSGYTGARVMAHMAGMTYRKVGFDSSPMYVNSGGYLVGSEAVLQAHGTQHLSFSLDHHSDLHYTESTEETANVA